MSATDGHTSTTYPVSEATAVTHTWVSEPGVDVDQETMQALTKLRDAQERRLAAQNRTEMALRRASQPTQLPPPDPQGKPPALVDTSHLHELVDWPDVEPIEDMQSSDRAFTLGEFRPVATDLRQEGGLRAENFSDGTHFYGDRHWGGDDLIRFSVGSTSHYVLPKESIPTSGSGRWRSDPPADIRGSIYGNTGNYLPPFHADDKWCHCVRVLRHALYQHVNMQWRVLGEVQRVDWLIKLQNVVQIGTAYVPMSGYMPMPVLDFGIVTRNEPIWAQVEIRFDVALEGDARIRFSPDNNPANSVVVRSFGWWARAI